MANVKISELDAIDALAATDAVPVYDASGADTNKATVTQFMTYITANLTNRDESIDSDMYIDGSIDNAHLADNAVDSDEIADGAVDAAHLASGAVYTATASKATAYTAGTDDPKEMYGGVIYVTAEATITLPAVVAGMSVTIIAIGAVEVTVQPNANDLIVLDGTALDNNDPIVSTSTTGDRATLTYYSADGWYARSDSWTDGGGA